MPAAESYPDDLRYHREHDWVRVDGDSATFGVTWYAQDALGDLVVYLPPEVGAEVQARAASTASWSPSRPCPASSRPARAR